MDESAYAHGQWLEAASLGDAVPAGVIDPALHTDLAALATALPNACTPTPSPLDEALSAATGQSHLPEWCVVD